MSTPASVRPEFTVHLLNDEGKATAHAIALKFSELLDYLDALDLTPREFALARTHLQDASFWAKRGMAMKASMNASHVSIGAPDVG